MPLDETLRALGADLRPEGPTTVPAHFGDTAAEVRILRKEAGWVDRSARGRLQLTGPDRLDFLQALFTNDVKSGQDVVYGMFLNPQGRMLADARIYRFADETFVDVEPAARESVYAHLDKFHFSEKLEIGDATAQVAQLGVFGPKAATVFEFLFAGARLPGHGGMAEVGFDDVRVRAAANSLIGETGYDLLVAAEHAAALAEKLKALNVKPVGWDALELARIEAGVPRFGQEMDEETIPLEAGLAASAISFNKGCYPGQEIIARIDARGEPAKRLVGFSVDGAPPPRLAPIRQGDRDVGKIMSAIRSPSLRGRTIAMGYLHKGVGDDAQDLSAGGAQLWIVPRPFYPPIH